MASYYLAPFIGSGVEDDAFRPDVDAASWSIIDFRPDSTQQVGWCVVRAEAVTRTGASVDYLGESTDLGSVLPNPVRNQLKNRLGVDIQQSSLDAILAELLVVWGEDGPGRTRWRPLKANIHGRHRIVMGGEVIYDAPAIQGATLTDDFNRADNASALGTSAEGWSWVNVTNWLEILNNQAISDIPGNRQLARADSALDSDDQFGQVTIIDRGFAAWSDGGPFLRMTGAGAQTGYQFLVVIANGNALIREVTNGSITAIASVAYTATSGDVLRGEVSGSNMQLLINGVKVADATNTVHTGNLYTGLFVYDDKSTFDDWSSGDLASDTLEDSFTSAAADGTALEDANTDIQWATDDPGANEYDITSSGTAISRGSADGTLPAKRASYPMSSADHSVKLTVSALDGSGQADRAACLIRGSHDMAEYIRLRYDESSNTGTLILDKPGGTIQTQAWTAPSLPFTIKLEAVGDQLSVYANDTLQFTATDATYDTNLYVGLSSNQRTVGGVIIDHFLAEVASAALSASLLATGTGTISSVVDEADTTVDLHLSVDDDPASPNDADWINNDGSSGSVFFDLTDLPADFGTMDTADLTIRDQGANFGTGTVTVYAQLFQSDETTTLSDEVQVSQATADSSFTNSTVTFTGLNTTATKSVWDAAKVRFRWVTT